MKKMLTLLALAGGITGHSQIFFESLNSANFKHMATNGIIYVESGDEAVDNVFENALEKYWTSTPYKSYAPDDVPAIDENHAILFTSSTSDSKPLVGLAP